MTGHHGPTPTRPAVSVLIVTYRTGEAVLPCIQSVRNECAATDEILIWDNDSRDGTPDLIGRTFPEVKLVRSSENLGFGVAVNRLAKEARNEFLVLLNPDALLVPGSIGALTDLERRLPRAGLYGGRCESPNGELDPGSCWGRRTLWSDVCFALGLDAAFAGSRWFDTRSLGGWERDTEREVGIVTGCLLACRKTVWEQLGGFDEAFWLYGEDADLSERAWGAGFSPMISPRACVIHEFGTASPNDAWRAGRILQAQVIQLAKRRTGARLAARVALLQAGVLIRAIGASVQPGGGRGSKWPAVWKQRCTWQRGNDSQPSVPG